MSTVEMTAIPTRDSAAAQPKRRAQRPMQTKFPCSMNFGITLAMHEAIQELCSPASHYTQSRIGQDALHFYLLSNSERYRRAIGGNGA
jgi:hypothetical protein